MHSVGVHEMGMHDVGMQSMDMQNVDVAAVSIHKAKPYYNKKNADFFLLYLAESFMQIRQWRLN